MTPEQEIYKKAIEFWGIRFQADMMIEECAELIKAICAVYRGRGTEFDIAEEVADVEIMCGQMRYVLGDDIVDQFKTEKLVRLKQRIEKANDTRRKKRT